MKIPRSKGPPITDNKEAAALIDRAKDRCEGCRLSWRLDLRHGGGWKHREPMPIECTAQTERQQLRDIAARSRAREHQI